jgi:hypothetical protein
VLPDALRAHRQMRQLARQRLKRRLQNQQQLQRKKLQQLKRRQLRCQFFKLPQ